MSGKKISHTFCARIADLVSAFDKGRVLYQRAGVLYESQKNAIKRASVLVKIGESFIATADFSESVDTFHGALKTGSGSDYTELYLRAHLGLGRAYLGIGNYDLALASFENAQALGGNLDDPAEFIKFVRAKTLVLRDLGRYDEAHQLALKVLKVVSGIGDRRVRSKAFRTVSACNKMIWRLNEALEYGRLAHSESERAFDIRGMGNACWAIGEAFRMQGRWSEALAAFDSGIRWQREAGDIENVFYSTISKAEVYSKQQLLLEANTEINYAEKLSEQLGPYEKLHVRLLKAVNEWQVLVDDRNLPLRLRKELENISFAYKRMRILWAQTYVVLILAYESSPELRDELLEQATKLAGGTMIPELKCLDALRSGRIASRQELLRYLYKRY